MYCPGYHPEEALHGELVQGAGWGLQAPRSAQPQSPFLQQEGGDILQPV